MNLVQNDENDPAGEDFVFQVARIPTIPPQLRAFSLVRCRRDDLLPAGNLLDEAVRQLSVIG